MSHIFIFFRLLLRLLCDSAQQKQLSCMGSHHLAGSSVLLRPGWRLSTSLSAFKYFLNFLETKSLKSSDNGLLVCKSLHHMTWINQSISALRGNKTEKSWCIEPYSPHGSISWINKKTNSNNIHTLNHKILSQLFPSYSSGDKHIDSTAWQAQLSAEWIITHRLGLPIASKDLLQWDSRIKGT